MSNHARALWLARFEEAVRLALAGRTDGLSLRAEPCPVHGDRCVRIVAAEVVVAHVEWPVHDAASWAENFIAGLSPGTQE